MEKQTQNKWYDLREDWVLIESSLAKQYGIRIRREHDMPYSEFCTLVAGLMPDTPLGQIVSIRAETDNEVIKRFSPEQKKIYNEWQGKIINEKLENNENLNKLMLDIEKSLASYCGGEKK